MELAPTAILAHFQTLQYTRPISLDGISSLCRYMQSLASKVPIISVQVNHEIQQQAENKTSEESRSSSTFYYYSFKMLGAYIVPMALIQCSVATSRSNHSARYLFIWRPEFMKIP
ncbi:purple acid phosphatase 15-like [Pyrus ussuriensis x Pyrus communis]|uniref:Purple acid phosphatase 15-like n=1 Tax=Pyrus ussuriensis x Pyrus communis TaxID=2448454 RepID=A0A5N5I7X2_9ROSA|nr:purple acid phosphatase 15-like [Pyrus ussuriensis x Pyrus communis]